METQPELTGFLSLYLLGGTSRGSRSGGVREFRFTHTSKQVLYRRAGPGCRRRNKLLKIYVVWAIYISKPILLQGIYKGFRTSVVEKAFQFLLQQYYFKLYHCYIIWTYFTYYFCLILNKRAHRFFVIKYFSVGTKPKYVDMLKINPKSKPG